MSEHELWNELGNLYFLSGFKNQAVHAYNKAIQMESNFGKPYSNLALIYTKQAKYKDAIKLYKKSLDLLTDEMEKAITWNRLGNVYRQLKEYQEAVYAYQCADNLISNNNEVHEFSNQMLYVSSESGSLPYEVFDDRHDTQNHHADFTLDIEPEFDESLPEFVPVEAEVVVGEAFNYQVNEKDQTGEDIDDSVPSPAMEIVENPVAVIHENRAFGSSKDMGAEVIAQGNSEVETLDELEEEKLPEESLNKWVAALEADNSTSLDNSLENEDGKAAVDELEPAPLEIDTNPDDEALSTDFTLVEPIARAEEDAGALPVGIVQTTPKKTILANEDQPETVAELLELDTQVDDDSLTDESALLVPEVDTSPEKGAPDTDSELTESFDQVEGDISALPDESPQTVQENIPPVDNVMETASGSATSLTPDGNGSDVIGESNSEPDIDNVSDDTIQDMKEGENIRDAEEEIVLTEEKLAKQIEINPRSATTWEALGTLYKTAGRYDEAIQAFEQAISIAPREVSYHHNLGLVYAAQGNNKDAFNTFQKVLELDPNHNLTHASLGGYYKKMGLDELAQEHIGKAMKHIYESENEYNRACLDAICGNIDQAIELLRIALENNQTYVDWVLSDPDLDSLRGDERFKQLIAEFSK
jgi:tetratricopeptide (TPR) repeat protein